MSVRIEKDGPVWTVIHSRPEARNAMDPESAAKHSSRRSASFDADDTAQRCRVLGRRRCFLCRLGFEACGLPCRGRGARPVRLSEMRESHRWRPWGPAGWICSANPLIAAVSGPAVAGGMELALWCDIRVMEETAFMGVYCRRWGIPLIDGGTVRLPRLVGEGRAMDLILTGRRVDADERSADWPVRIRRARRRRTRQSRSPCP